MSMALTLASRAIELIDAPSSAAAFAAGQEKAPAAMRRAGLLEHLRALDVDVLDTGGPAPQRWRPDRASPNAQNAELVVASAADVRDRVAGALQSSRRALVLGGDCTVGLGTLAGATAIADEPPSWLYFDLHADLNTTTSVRDGALDWTGMAHAFALPDTVPALTQLTARVPMISPERVVLFSHDLAHATPWEAREIRRLRVQRISAAEVEAHPVAAAEAALGRLDESRPVVIHFDVDAVNFTHAPLSENTGRDSGITLDAAMTALQRLAADGRVSALTVTELNPDHAAADPDVLPTFVAKLAAAIAAAP